MCVVGFRLFAISPPSASRQRRKRTILLMNRVMRKFEFGLCAALLLAVSAADALAQNFPGPAGPPGPAGRNPACVRLEAQLSAVDRGTADPARADQIRRFEEASNKQQVELDKLVARSRRAGCQ